MLVPEVTESSICPTCLTTVCVCTLCCYREAKYLQRMGVHVPEVACTLLLQEEKFKLYFAQLSHLVSAWQCMPQL